MYDLNASWTLCRILKSEQATELQRSLVTARSQLTDLVGPVVDLTLTFLYTGPYGQPVASTINIGNGPLLTPIDDYDNNGEDEDDDNNDDDDTNASADADADAAACDHDHGSDDDDGDREEDENENEADGDEDDDANADAVR